MRIPVGNFGYQTADTASNRRAPPVDAFVQRGGEAIAGALTNIAGDMRSEQIRLERQQEAEAKAAAKEAARVKSITAQATAKNELADMYDQSVTGLADGSVDKTTLVQKWGEQSQKVIEKAVSSVGQEHQELIRASLLDDHGRAQRDMRKMVAQQDRQDIAGGIVAYTEQMQRYAMRGDSQRMEAIQNVDAFMRSAGPQAGIKPADIEKSVQGFKEGVTFTYLDGVVSKVAGSNKALKGIITDLASDKYAELDPTKRNFLESKIQRNMDHNNRVAEIAHNRRMSELDRYQKRLSWYVENGQEIPSNELVAFDRASKGTPYAGMVGAILNEQKQVAEFSRLPPDQMVAKANDLRASYGATPSKEQLQHLNKVGAFVDKSIKFLRESPLEYAVQREGAKVEPLDFTKPESWASNLQTRVVVLTEQSKRTGTTPKGLFPQEVAALSQVLKAGTVEQKSMILTQLRQGFGDEKVYRATMQQIAPDNPVIAAAGIAASRGLQSNQARPVADMILRGQQILNPDKKTDGQGKLLAMPSEEEMTSKFAGYEQDAFAGKEQTRSAFYQTAKAIYAAKSVETGDYSGALNSKRWNESIALATGGIETYRGRAIVLPYGKDYGNFKDDLKARVRALSTSDTLDKSFTREKLLDLPLENVGDGRYVLRAGDGVVSDKNGKPVVIDFNTPVPESTSSQELRGVDNLLGRKKKKP